MSQQLIDRSPDLKQLRDEGYDVEIRSSHLLIKDVPYVSSDKQIKFGTLVSELNLSGDVTTTPNTHVAHFIGDHPCDQNGAIIRQIKHKSENQAISNDIIINHSFSAKPRDGYKDYYIKMTTYVNIISGPAHAIDTAVTARTFPAITTTGDESVFNYCDTASSRAQIVSVTKKLEIGKVAIVGVGGTGSYVLDLLAKTPIKEIHLFDGDLFLNHNAFRSPGAPSVDELRSKFKKTTYLKNCYSKMHRGIVEHNYHIDESNIDHLQEIDFLFLCLDSGGNKRSIVEYLERRSKPFIDVGMGVDFVDESLRGILRITTSTIGNRNHVWEKNRIPFSDGDGNNEYSKNIQIADLNALNAALAVIKWKKLCGFYQDIEKEHFSAYTINGNSLINEDMP